VQCAVVIRELQVEIERIARQNLEAELQRTLDKLSSTTASCVSLQQTELVYHSCHVDVYDISVYYSVWRKKEYKIYCLGLDCMVLNLLAALHNVDITAGNSVSITTVEY